jgi:spermidine synthase
VAVILPTLVFSVGAAALGIEIAAVRLLAPYFGASTIVWANTIGIVLVALSVGYWWGGRLADRRPELRAMCRVIMAAAVVTAAVPFVSRPLLDVGVEALDAVSAGAFVGSMLATLLLIAAPVLLLGTVAPWALRIGIGRVEDSGQLAGRLYAVSTLGSLMGTLVAALLLIPALGTRRTFLLFALLLSITALIGLRPPRAYLAVPVAIAALMLVPTGTIKRADGERVVYETETAYQYARVVEGPTGRRVLELNEGQAIHSLYDPAAPTPLTGTYWDGHLLWTFATTGRAPRRVAMLGNAAGTVSSTFARYLPETRIDGVEIDGELSRIGRRYFAMDNPRLTVHDQDARPFLRGSKARYDSISLDTYRQPYIPFYLVTREFFQLARSRLTGGGVLIVNVGHPRGQFELEQVLTATLSDVFRYVRRDPVEPSNTLLVASDRPVEAGKLLAAASGFAPELAYEAERAAARLAPPLTGGSVYTDDKSPVEWLIDRSIVDYASGES